MLLSLTSGCSAVTSFTDSLNEKLLGTVKVAIDLPEPERNAALLAIQQADRPEYGVENFRIEPVIIDPPSRTRAEGLANIKRVLADRVVKVLVGPSTDDAARAMIPLADKNGGLTETMAIVAPFITDPCLTVPTSTCQGGEPDSLYPRYSLLPGSSKKYRIRNFWRLSPASNLAGAVAADYATDSLDSVKALILADTGPGSADFSTQFVQRYRVRGGEVDASAQYDFGAGRLVGGDFSSTIPSPGLGAPLAQLLAASAGKVDLVVFGGTDGEAAAVRKTMLASGFSQNVPLLGSEGIRTDAFLKAAGAAANGTYAVSPLVNADQLDEAADFMAQYRAVFPNPADYGPKVVYAYDATNLAIAGIRNAIHLDPGVSPDRDRVNFAIQLINQPSSFIARTDPSFDASQEGVMGKHTFSLETGDGSPKIFSFYQATDGAWRFQDHQEFRG